MSPIPDDQRAFVRCTNCDEIITGSVTRDGELVPVGADDDGKCGDADLEVATMQDPAEGRQKSV